MEDASSELIDLSAPSPAWLNRLLGFKNLNEALRNEEGPRVFASASSLAELQERLALPDEARIQVLKRASSALPAFLHSLESFELNEDPDEWNSSLKEFQPEDSDSVLLVYLQNPAFLSGSSLPQGILAKLVEDLAPLKEKWSRVVILADETYGSFTWELSEEAGQILRLRPSLLGQWEVYILLRPDAVLDASPQNAEIKLWPVPASLADQRLPEPLVASPVAWKLLQRNLNQGIELVRFRHLTLRNLKFFAYALTELIQQKKIHVEHWPLSGLYASVTWTEPSGQDPRLFLKRLEHAGVKLHEGSLERGQMRICFVLDHAPFQKGILKLVKLLNEGIVP